jgi:hypothetical protein
VTARAAWLVVVAFLVLPTACNGQIETPAAAEGDGGLQARLLAPERSTFPPVGDMLEATCGTLDCHGQVGRNLRLYGARGLRLDPKDNPADNVTTTREYDESYWSVIGLEPEILSAVVAAHGSGAERLTLVRKPRELDAHKGGKLMAAGDARDRCLLSWLAGATSAAACAEGKQVSRPGAAAP